MLQRLARVLVLFFQRLTMSFFGRDALLQVNHLLGELRVFQGLAVERFSGFTVSGLLVGQRPLGLLQLLARGLRLGFQGCGDLLVLRELLGVPGLRRSDPRLGFLVDAGGQAAHQVLDRLADGDSTAGGRPFLFPDLFQVAMDRALGAGAQLFAHRIDGRIAPGGEQFIACAQHF